MQLSKAIRVEMLEHPWAGKRIATRIAKDHARKKRNPATPARKPAYPRNSVLLFSVNYYGEPVGLFYRAHNGSVESIRKEIQILHRQVLEEDGWGGPSNPNGMYNVNSRFGATDAQGKAAWVISPNFKHISRVGTREARYTLGDLNARPNPSSASLGMTRRSSPYEMMMEWAHNRYGRDRGLNADWSVSAFLLKGRDLKDALYLVDNEDDSWSIVHRMWKLDGDESESRDIFTGTASAIRKKLTRGEL